MKGTILFFISFIFTFKVLICDDTGQESKSLGEGVEANTNTTATNQTEYKLPDEILENYAHYKTLENFTGETCSFESSLEDTTEIILKDKILSSNCIPNWRTFVNVLEAGWTDLAEFLVQNIYLPRLIDPSHTIYTYIKKYESQTGKLNFLLEGLSKYETLPINYKFENFDDSIKIIVKLPDPSYVAEYLSVYCYKDLLKVHALFRSRSKLIRLKDTKTLYDKIESNCEYNYNSYEHQIDVQLNKINRLKKWNSLFKN